MENSKSGISFDSYRRLEAELESVKATVKDMNELNRTQEINLIDANEKARKASERADKLANEAAAAKQAAAHAIKMSISMSKGDPEDSRGDASAKGTENNVRSERQKSPEKAAHDAEEASVHSSSIKSSASPEAPESPNAATAMLAIMYQLQRKDQMILSARLGRSTGAKLAEAASQPLYLCMGRVRLAR